MHQKATRKLRETSNRTVLEPRSLKAGKLNIIAQITWKEGTQDKLAPSSVAVVSAKAANFRSSLATSSPTGSFCSEMLV